MVYDVIQSKQIFDIVNQADGEKKKSNIRRLTEEMKLLKEKTKDDLSKLRKSDCNQESAEDNIIMVPDLSKNTEENIDSKELKELLEFDPSTYPNKEDTAMQLQRFLRKIYGFIRQKKYTDSAAVLVLMDRLQTSRGRNPALEHTEMCIDYYENKFGRQPTLKELTKNLENRYCSDFQPQNAMRKVDKITREEGEDDIQFVYRMTELVKRAAMTLDENVRKEWKDNKCFEIFISRIKNYERNIILNENATRENNNSFSAIS